MNLTPEFLEELRQKAEDGSDGDVREYLSCDTVLALLDRIAELEVALEKSDRVSESRLHFLVKATEPHKNA